MARTLAEVDADLAALEAAAVQLRKRVVALEDAQPLIQTAIQNVRDRLDAIEQAGPVLAGRVGDLEQADQDFKRVLKKLRSILRGQLGASTVATRTEKKLIRGKVVMRAKGR